MKKSELILALQAIEGDFEIAIKVPSEYPLPLKDVQEPVLKDRMITLCGE